MGASYVNAVAAIAVTWWPWYARLARAQTLSVRERAYIEAARGIGVRDRIIMLRHVFPNILTPIIVQGTLDVGTAILVAAGLSFIGLGTQAPFADWGVMISDGRLFFLSGTMVAFDFSRFGDISYGDGIQLSWRWRAGWRLTPACEGRSDVDSCGRESARRIQHAGRTRSTLSVALTSPYQKARFLAWWARQAAANRLPGAA